MSKKELPSIDGSTILLVDATTGAETVVLPAQFATSRRYLVRRKDSGPNPVTVSVASGQFLDGIVNATTLVDPDSERTFIASDPGQWESIGLSSASLNGTFATQSLGNVTDVVTARGNLGLGAAATKSMPQVAADSALTGAFAPGGTDGSDQAYQVGVSVKDKRFAGGAVPDVQVFSNVNITSGQATLTRASGTFSTSLAGKTAILRAAGASGADLTTTVSSVATDGSSITLAATAGTTLSGGAGYAAIGTDSTAAFDAARGSSRTIYVPGGQYIYTGSGLSIDGLHLEGIGSTATVIFLGTGKWLVGGGGGTETMRVAKLKFMGGYGGIHLTNTSYSVGGIIEVESCQFSYFTAAGIASALTDQPYWKIRKNSFYPSPTTVGTVCVSLNGDNSQSVIEENAFFLLNGGVGIKMGYTAGLASLIKHNDFIRFAAYSGTARTDIWLAGQAGGNGGLGLVVAFNKFGNEGIHANDYRVLVADEDGASNSDPCLRTPNLATPSTMRFSFAKFESNMYASGSGAAPSFLTICTPDVRNCAINDLSVAGTTPAYIVNYPLAAPVASTNITNVAHNVMANDAQLNGGSMQLCNKPALWSHAPANPSPFAVASGHYYKSPATATGTQALALGDMKVAAIDLAPCTLSRIGTEITTAGSTGAVVRLGIYCDLAGVPGALILDAGTVDATTTGGKELTINQQVPGGRYWLVSKPEVATSTQRSLTVAGQAGSSMSDMLGNALYGAAGVATNAGVAAGSFPATFPAFSHAGSVPLIFVKLA